MSETPEHVLRNRAAWNRLAAEYEEPGRRNWAQEEPSWGIWSVPEAQLGVFPTELEGLDAIELGCGTGYVSSWLARRGARPVGIDSSEAQLATAGALQAEFGIEFPLLHGNAEEVPIRTRASTWRSPSTAPASGATPTAGFRRRRGCCVPAAG
jgi:2-polyprenyl-3-methyl-5-hydroxy-6-metoxy-1,4-benzoquinol methylase